MGLDPEVIPSTSKDGYKAKKLKEDRGIYFLIIFLLLSFVVIVKIVIKTILIGLGIGYIFHLAFDKSKTSS